MRPSIWSIECEKYESIEIEWYKIALWKETNKSITSTAEMLRGCLICWKHKEWCKKLVDFVRHLNQ